MDTSMSRPHAKNPHRFSSAAEAAILLNSTVGVRHRRRWLGEDIHPAQGHLVGGSLTAVLLPELSKICSCPSGTEGSSVYCWHSKE